MSIYVVQTLTEDGWEKRGQAHSLNMAMNAMIMWREGDLDDGLWRVVNHLGREQRRMRKSEVSQARDEVLDLVTRKREKHR